MCALQRDRDQTQMTSPQRSPAARAALAQLREITETIAERQDQLARMSAAVGDMHERKFAEARHAIESLEAQAAHLRQEIEKDRWTLKHRSLQSLLWLGFGALIGAAIVTILSGKLGQLLGAVTGLLKGSAILPVIATGVEAGQRPEGIKPRSDIVDCSVFAPPAAPARAAGSVCKCSCISKNICRRSRSARCAATSARSSLGRRL